MLLEPSLFKNINLANTELDYKWNDNIEEKLTEGYNQKLIDLLSQCNYKAVFGLGVAASEWVFWRFKAWRPKLEGKGLDVIMQYTQAHWIGLIDKYYLFKWDYTASHVDNNKIESIIWFITSQYVFTRHFYTTNDQRLCLDVSRYIMLAQHVCPDQKAFEQWLTNCLKKMAELFPNEQIDEDGEENKSYDSNQDPFIPREFYFEPDFDYQTADLTAMANKLLLETNYENNEFLNSPQQAIKDGFAGVPYQLK